MEGVALRWETAELMTWVLHRARLYFTREFQAGQRTILEAKESLVFPPESVFAALTRSPTIEEETSIKIHAEAAGRRSVQRDNGRCRRSESCRLAPQTDWLKGLRVFGSWPERLTANKKSFTSDQIYCNKLLPSGEIGPHLFRRSLKKDKVTNG